MASNRDRGVCAAFHEPAAAAALLPFGLLAHHSLTFTVDQPEKFVARLGVGMSLAHSSCARPIHGQHLEDLSYKATRRVGKRPDPAAPTVVSSVGLDACRCTRHARHQKTDEHDDGSGDHRQPGQAGLQRQ